MRIPVFLAFILCLGWGILQAQPAVIKGTDPGYKGIQITLTVAGHPFMENPLYEAAVVCDSLGTFRIEAEVNRGVMVRLRAGIYDAGLYVEPGKIYEILLPPYKELVYAERISPFFEPLKVPLKVWGDPGDINHQIYRFDSLFHNLNEQVILSRRMGKDNPADSLAAELSAQFSSGTSAWFDAYRKYKTGILHLNAGRTGLESLSRHYLGPEIREMHPAFLELFGAMFKDFLVYYNRTKEGEGIRYQINRTHHLDSLRKSVMRHPAVWNDTLADLILLQELPAMFYRGDFHKEAILILLDSMEAHPVKPAFARYAAEWRDKLASLVIGYPPPPFCLTATDGRSYSPGDFKGKYTYLIFCTPEHYGCMMEYPFSAGIPV